MCVCGGGKCGFSSEVEVQLRSAACQMHEGTEAFKICAESGGGLELPGSSLDPLLMSSRREYIKKKNLSNFSLGENR